MGAETITFWGHPQCLFGDSFVVFLRHVLAASARYMHNMSVSRSRSEEEVPFKVRGRRGPIFEAL